MGGSNTAVFSEAFSLPVMVILYIMTALFVIEAIVIATDNIVAARERRREQRSETASLADLSL